MSRLDSALAQFSAALEALERVAQARLAAEDALPAAERQIAALKADLVRLSEERRRLEGLNDQVAGRLDTAIRDIRFALSAEAAE